MSRPNRLLPSAFIAAGLLVGSARGQNLEQSFYTALYPSEAPFHAQMNVPLFDPSLGTLIEVRIVLTPHFGATLRAENTDVGPESVTLLFAGEVTVSRGGSPLANSMSSGYVSQFLSPYDGTLDFIGSSGMTQHIHDHQSTTTSIPPSSPEFDAFVAQAGSTVPGHFDVDGMMFPQCEPAGSPVIVFESRAATGPEVTVTYVYSVSGSAFCPGDGSGSACPCSNSGLAGHGCSSPATFNGVLLAGSGDASVSADTFVLTATDLPQFTMMTVLQGDAGTFQGVPFGAGLRCVTGNVVRVVTTRGGPTVSVGSGTSDPSLSVAGSIPSSGGTRYYQFVYREGPGACNAAPLNSSNAWRVTWRP